MIHRAAGVLGTLLGGLFYLAWEVHDRLVRRLRPMPAKRCRACEFDWPPSFAPAARCPVCGSQTLYTSTRPCATDADAREFLRVNQPPRIATDAELEAVMTPEEEAELAADWEWIEGRLARWPLGEEAEIWLARASQRREAA